MPDTGSPIEARWLGRPCPMRRDDAPATRNATRPPSWPLRHDCHPVRPHTPASSHGLAVTRHRETEPLQHTPNLKTGKDRPSGGFQAADHPWCQSRQGGLCSTSIDTTFRSTPDIKSCLADPSPREPGAGSRAQLRADCSQAPASAACRSERPRSNAVADGRGLNTPRPRAAQAGC